MGYLLPLQALGLASTLQKRLLRLCVSELPCDSEWLHHQREAAAPWQAAAWFAKQTGHLSPKEIAETGAVG